MLTKEQFFAKYSLTDEYLEKAGTNWETLPTGKINWEKA